VRFGTDGRRFGFGLESKQTSHVQDTCGGKSSGALLGGEQAGVGDALLAVL
jgi:hypothetical protein